MSNTFRVLVTCPQMQRTFHHFSDQLDAAAIECDLPEVVQALSEAQLIEIIDRYDGMIAGDDEVTGAVLRKGSRLKVISKWGVGVDGIDRGAADELGIVVTNTPGAFGNEVADVAMGYVVLLARGLHLIDSSVRNGGWDKPVGMTLSDHTLGVIGLGSIGLDVAVRAKAFGMNIFGFDPFEAQQKKAEAIGVTTDSLAEVLRESRFVVLCCPLTPDNHHLINSETIGQMREDAFLVNVARGPLVDENALVEALNNRAMAGAALDVFEVEPLPMASPLRDFPNVILGSHNGSNTEEGTLRVSRMAVQNLIDRLGES